MKEALLVGLVPVWLLAADSFEGGPRAGRDLPLMRLESSRAERGPAVVFLPGDGGWRGAAVTMGRSIAAWGYDVWVLDTKKYLETFSMGGAKLSRQEMAADVGQAARRAAEASHGSVVLIGWSQGASMAIAAVSDAKRTAAIQGVITVGLPESGVLGWDWKATLASIARREPDQPSFAVKPLLPAASPAPVWMIHGTGDEYTTAESARALFNAAREPKQFEAIDGANHRFDGHQAELYASLKRGLAWVASR